MTAPTGDDGLREALAERIAEAWITGTPPPEIVRHYVDALLPVVLRYGREKAAAVLRAAAQEQRNEAATVPDTDEGTHAGGHRCAADFIDRRVDRLTAQDPT